MTPIPTKQRYAFRNFHHWTLEIDGTCYELSPDKKKKFRVAKFVTDMFGLLNDACPPHDRDAESWHKDRKACDIEPERRRVGQTRKTREEITAEGNIRYFHLFRCAKRRLMTFITVDHIWKDFNNGCYGLLTQNCQNFVLTLCSRILVSEDDPEVSKTERDSWEKLPKPISHPLADGSKGTLAGGAGYGTIAAYLTALADVAEATEAGGIVAGAAAAEGIESAAAQGALGSAGAIDAAAQSGAAAGAVSGGTATGGAIAAGEAGAGGAASGGVAAAGSTTAGGTVAGGTTAAGGATSAGAASAGGGGTAGSTTAASESAVGAGSHAAGTVGGKGVAAGAGKGAAATKAGLGAKFAGVGHATVHGAAAAKAAFIGGGMVKAGGAAAIANPVAGAAIAGTGAALLLLAARGKRDKRWLKKNSNGEFSAEEILEMEDQMLDQEANKGLVAELEKQGEEIDGELAEDMKFARISTEPASLPGDEASRAQAVPAGEAPERAQTTS